MVFGNVTSLHWATKQHCKMNSMILFAIHLKNIKENIYLFSQKSRIKQFSWPQNFPFSGQGKVINMNNVLVSSNNLGSTLIFNLLRRSYDVVYRFYELIPRLYSPTPVIFRTFALNYRSWDILMTVGIACWWATLAHM